MTKPTQEQIRHWYKKAKDSGFKDIESPEHNYIHRLPSVSLTDVHCNNVVTSLHDTENAEYWRMVGRAAAELSPNHSHYVLYNAFADSGSFSEAAREAGISYNKAAFAIRKWLSKLGINSRPWKRNRASARSDRKVQHEGS